MKTSTKTDKVVMTFDEVDEFIGQASAIELFNYRGYWPEPDEVEKYEKRIGKERLIQMFLWLESNNPAPNNEAEQASKKYMKNYLYNNLEILDEKPAIKRRRRKTN